MKRMGKRKKRQRAGGSWREDRGSTASVTQRPLPGPSVNQESGTNEQLSHSTLRSCRSSQRPSTTLRGQRATGGPSFCEPHTEGPSTTGGQGFTARPHSHPSSRTRPYSQSVAGARTRPLVSSSREPYSSNETVPNLRNHNVYHRGRCKRSSDGNRTEQRHQDNPRPHNHGNRLPHGGGDTANTTSHQPSSSQGSEEDATVSTNSSNVREIPGFYYDVEKKKYFKILPGHQSANNNMLTREIIKLKKTEEARQQSLREFALKTIRMDPAYADAATAQKARCQYSRNIIDHISSIHTGAKRTHEARLLQHRLINHQLRNLISFCKQKIYPRNERDTAYKRLEHMTQMCVAPGDESRVLCLWSLEGLIVQRIQMLKIDRLALQGATPAEGAAMSVMPIGAVLLQSFSKVTNICWAPSAPDQTVNVPVLYTTTCFIGNSPSLALLRTLDDEHHPTDSKYAEFHLGHNTTWTCAWSAQKQKFSIGTKENALVIDVATRKLWELSTKKSDVYSQTFNHANGNTLYSGTRKGVIVGHDLRSNSTRHVTALHHKSPVCHLHLLKNDSQLIAADFSGRLCMWDLRMQSVVQDYIGHNNEYVRLPFKVDPSESVICGVGQDCYTRLWDLQMGNLLTSVPPPYPASRDLIPSVSISTAPHGRIDRPGILMGIKDELHFYAA